MVGKYLNMGLTLNKPEKQTFIVTLRTSPFVCCNPSGVYSTRRTVGNGGMKKNPQEKQQLSRKSGVGRDWSRGAQGRLALSKG